MSPMPREWSIVAYRDSETHDLLCDAVIDDAGYLLINDVLYEAITWTACDEASWRWTLRRCDAPRV